MAIASAVWDLLAPAIDRWEVYGGRDWVGFHLASTTPIGGRLEGLRDVPHGLSFAVFNVAEESADVTSDRRSDTEYFPAVTLAGLEKCFGFRPRSAVLLGSDLNADPAHRLLGEVTAHLCERLGGIVDFEGSLYGHPPREVERSFSRDPERRAAQRAAYVRAAVASLPGRCVTTELLQYADAEFLRAWLAHPAFAMVK